MRFHIQEGKKMGKKQEVKKTGVPIAFGMFWLILSLRHPEGHGESPMAFLFVGEAEGKRIQEKLEQEIFFKKNWIFDAKKKILFSGHRWTQKFAKRLALCA